MVTLVGVTFYLALCACAGFIFFAIMAVHEYDLARFCNRTGISYNSLPAILLLISLIWPISVSVIIIYLLCKVAFYLMVTFTSLYCDIKKIVKKE